MSYEGKETKNNKKKIQTLYIFKWINNISRICCYAFKSMGRVFSWYFSECKAAFKSGSPK